MSANHFLEQIRRELTGEQTAEVIPEGYFTIQQIAETLGCSQSTAMRRVKTAGAKMESRTFRVKSSDGRLMPSPHYRFAQ